MNTLLKYEKQELKRIHEWKNPPATSFKTMMKAINYPIQKVGDFVSELPGIDWVIEKAIGGLISMLNDFSQWTVLPEAIYKEYQKNEFDINTSNQIYTLDLKNVDKTIGYLGAKYKSIALAEGAAATNCRCSCRWRLQCLFHE